MNKSHFADFFAYIFDPLHRIWSRHAREIPLIRIFVASIQQPPRVFVQIFLTFQQHDVMCETTQLF